MTDCLIVGFNDYNFEAFVEMTRSMGENSGAYRDVNLAFIELDGKPHNAMDVLNRFHLEGQTSDNRRFHNADFLWPAITYLGTYLARRGYSFDYVNLPGLEKEKFKEKLKDEKLLTIAITTTVYVSVHPILELMKFIKEHNSQAKVIVGGPYVSNLPKMIDNLSFQRLLKYIGADVYVISNEGEATLVNVLEALKRNEGLEHVDNIAYKRDGKYLTTKTSIESNPLEENMVDYTLFRREEIGEFVTLRTAKSCPFSCSFCGFPQRAGKYKYLSVELVEQELNAIRDIGGVTTLTFIDDTFNVPKERFKQILEMMIRNDYGFKWNSFYRSDHGDERTIELMAKAGCEGVFLGVESGSDKQLERMNKTSRRKNYLRAIPLLREMGIRAHANFVVGFPGETLDTYEQSVSLIEIAKPDTYRAQLWYADPVTPIWKEKDAYGVKGAAFSWSHNTMDSQTACELVDQMLLNVRNSVWLPQNGFEMWSTFYLQRRGMAFGEVDEFLRCFAEVKKAEIRSRHAEGGGSCLIEKLKASCRFKDRGRATPRD